MLSVEKNDRGAFAIMLIQGRGGIATRNHALR